MQDNTIDLIKKEAIPTQKTAFQDALDNALIMHNMIDTVRSDMCSAYDVQINALVSVLNDTLSFALEGHDEWVYAQKEAFKELKARALSALLL